MEMVCNPELSHFPQVQKRGYGIYRGCRLKLVYLSRKAMNVQGPNFENAPLNVAKFGLHICGTLRSTPSPADRHGSWQFPPSHPLQTWLREDHPASENSATGAAFKTPTIGGFGKSVNSSTIEDHFRDTNFVSTGSELFPVPHV